MTIASPIIDAFRAVKLPTDHLIRKSRYMIADTERQMTYFVKLTDSGEDIERFEGETESLRALGQAAPNLVPRLYTHSHHAGRSVMITEFFNLSPPSSNSEAELGRRLAAMHAYDDNPGCRSPNGMYGFHVPTHCGETKQNNEWRSDWLVFFRDCRLADLINRIADREISELGKKICDDVVPFLLKNFEPKPRPVIIHGDLWSGNIALNAKNEQVVLYDPSSYYGHNEVELGIMKMFGGRSTEFFEQYHSILPRSEPHHEQRIRLYELYHHLNHTLIFGGSYRSGAIRIMKELIRFVQHSPE